MVQSDYLHRVFNNEDLKSIIKGVAKACKEAKYLYNQNNRPIKRFGLVGRGLSGTIVVPSVALKLGWPFIIVRKDHSHSCMEAEGEVDFRRYIFVDDFISSGCTFCTVNDEMDQYNIKPAAIIEYNRNNGDNPKDEIIYHSAEYIDNCDHKTIPKRTINKIIFMQV
jgi:adenine/guanine phosphoribosyltransferase-like PRPP-binding protein